jgi:hypothetical protein
MSVLCTVVFGSANVKAIVDPLLLVAYCVRPVTKVSVRFQPFTVRAKVSSYNWSANWRPATCDAGNVNVATAESLTWKSVSLCRRTPIAGTIFRAPKSGLVMAGTSAGSASACNVRLPGGVGVGVGDALEAGDGDGDGVGGAGLASPLGAGDGVTGTLNASVHE